MKYFSIDQIARSLDRLAKVHPFFGMSFLVFKLHHLPVGATISFTFSNKAEVFLAQHYRVTDLHEGYYNPYKTSNPSQRWVAARYPSTSLQRITTDTFRDALIHSKGSSEWGWREDYVEQLRHHLEDQLLPMWDLAVWVYKDVLWDDDVASEVVLDRFSHEFNLSDEEIRHLFSASVDIESSFHSAPISESELLGKIGYPPGSVADGTLGYVELVNLGPTKRFEYNAAGRLNVITGDNSLGKSFLLDCVWWVLTGHWISTPVSPSRDSVAEPKLNFGLCSSSGVLTKHKGRYQWRSSTWVSTPPKKTELGLSIYARWDGSFAVRDPARSHLGELSGHDQVVTFQREEIWNGIPYAVGDLSAQRSKWICNGLIRDWTAWQLGGERYQSRFVALAEALESLSPHEGERLIPGDPTRVPGDARDIPTIRMSYGDTPVTHVSAGVQRILAFAYVLVWTWFEHVENSKTIREDASRNIVLLVDEVEAHLHPFWQRTVVPSMLKVFRALAPVVGVQVHLATHSPIVLASVEGLWAEESDSLFHLKLKDGYATLEELPFVRRGRADRWLTSEVFGLIQPRSLEGEGAIRRATALQLDPNAEADEVASAHEALLLFLPHDDEFWPRWLYFAEKKGVSV